MILRKILIASLVAATVTVAHGFSSALFQEAPTLQRTTPSKMEGIDIEMPDFDELFGRIQQVSPLARQVITGGTRGGKKGFTGTDDSNPENLKWKTIEANKKRTVHKIEKIDNFQGHHAPLLRFRSSLKGPCVGECFGNFIMTLEERKKWDKQTEQVYEIYPINDLDSANIAMHFGRYGDCSRLGIGYCQTKAALGITPREQLTLCGIQDFTDGSCIIWGIEMEEWHNHLLPEGQRHTRAKSHIFSTTLTPTSENTFDVEYVLQLEIGGKLPTWLTTPIMVETIKSLFGHAKGFFAGSEELDSFLQEQAKRDDFANRHSLLMTP